MILLYNNKPVKATYGGCVGDVLHYTINNKAVPQHLTQSIKTVTYSGQRGRVLRLFEVDGSFYALADFGGEKIEVALSACKIN